MGKSKRQAAKESRERKRLLTRIIWIGITVILVAVVGAILWSSFQPALGESVAIMPNTAHVDEGTDPGPYNSEPPTSGRHYASEYEAGFYDETSREFQVQYPEGYLVHNLEHGYVIFWYNCAQVGESGCDGLKDQIRSVLDKEDNFKVIAFPRPSLDVPVVLTSWGQKLEFEKFDPAQARSFVRSNRNKAPEPDAP